MTQNTTKVGGPDPSNRRLKILTGVLEALEELTYDDPPAEGTEYACELRTLTGYRPDGIN